MKREIEGMFEVLSSDSQSTLLGGFSASYASVTLDTSGGGETNNCLGGNCASACGPFHNIGCNTYTGCSN